jgi:hypothetical protein
LKPRFVVHEHHATHPLLDITHRWVYRFTKLRSIRSA